MVLALYKTSTRKYLTILLVTKLLLVSYLSNYNQTDSFQGLMTSQTRRFRGTQINIKLQSPLRPSCFVENVQLYETRDSNDTQNFQRLPLHQCREEPPAARVTFKVFGTHKHGCCVPILKGPSMNNEASECDKARSARGSFTHSSNCFACVSCKGIHRMLPCY